MAVVWVFCEKPCGSICRSIRMRNRWLSLRRMRVGGGRRWWSGGCRLVGRYRGPSTAQERPQAVALSPLRMTGVLVRESFSASCDGRHSKSLQQPILCHPERSRFFAGEEAESRRTPIGYAYPAELLRLHHGQHHGHALHWDDR